MARPNFGKVLDRKASEVEPPKNLPPGSYIFLTRGVPVYDESSIKKTEFVRYTCVPQGPIKNGDGGNADVDQEELDQALTKKNGDKVAITSKAMRLDFYLTEEALYRLKNFLRHCGWEIPEEDGEENPDLPDMREMTNTNVNKRFGGYVTHEPARDGSDRMFANISRTFALEE